MTKVISDNDPLISELRELENEYKQAADQARTYENTLTIVKKTIRKNQLTIKQLQAVPADRNVYIPLGRAQKILQPSFLKRNKQQTITQINNASKKLQQNLKDLQKNYKYYSDKTNQKYQIYKDTTQKIKKKIIQNNS